MYMMKKRFTKILSLALAVVAVMSLSITGFAKELYTTNEVSDREIWENGTLVKSELIQREGKDYIKETYVYTQEVETRGADVVNTKTLMDLFVPVSKEGRAVSDSRENSDGLRLTIQWVTSSSPTNWFPNEEPVTGYRLTRVSVNRLRPTTDGISLQQLNAYNHYPRAVDPVKRFSLTSDSTSVTKYLNFNNYIADVYDAKLGATLYYNQGGSQHSMDLFLIG